MELQHAGTGRVLGKADQQFVSGQKREADYRYHLMELPYMVADIQGMRERQPG